MSAVAAGKRRWLGQLGHGVRPRFDCAFDVLLDLIGDSLGGRCGGVGQTEAVELIEVEYAREGPDSADDQNRIGLPDIAEYLIRDFDDTVAYLGLSCACTKEAPFRSRILESGRVS